MRFIIIFQYAFHWIGCTLSCRWRRRSSRWRRRRRKPRRNPTGLSRFQLCLTIKFESLCIYREQLKLWLFYDDKLSAKIFHPQNSLSTVSLGKLGEDGGEEGLDVEEEWGRDSMLTWTICLIVKLVFVQINMCLFLLPVKSANKFNIYLYSLVSNGKTANRKKTDKRHPYWLRPESTGFLIRQ